MHPNSGKKGPPQSSQIDCQHDSFRPQGQTLRLLVPNNMDRGSLAPLCWATAPLHGVQKEVPLCARRYSPFGERGRARVAIAKLHRCCCASRLVSGRCRGAGGSGSPERHGLDLPLAGALAGRKGAAAARAVAAAVAIAPVASAGAAMLASPAVMAATPAAPRRPLPPGNERRRVGRRARGSGLEAPPGVATRWAAAPKGGASARPAVM
mmetsp:Transcript_129272/g.360015  ORF Transcript_129272/g.360015 Transcript_129272/m.360015 type:complete len:209 (-) Transcript_129272:1140-1766(-)